MYVGVLRFCLVWVLSGILEIFLLFVGCVGFELDVY